MINIQGVWNVIQGATKIPNKSCAKSLLSMLLIITLKIHLTSFCACGTL